jgi:hypothetical protein
MFLLGNWPWLQRRGLCYQSAIGLVFPQTPLIPYRLRRRSGPAQYRVRPAKSLILSTPRKFAEADALPMRALKNTRRDFSPVARDQARLSKRPMQPAKEPADPERDHDGGIRLMLNRIDDRSLQRSGGPRYRLRGFALWGCSVVCWTEVSFFCHGDRSGTRAGYR